MFIESSEEFQIFAEGYEMRLRTPSALAFVIAGLAGSLGTAWAQNDGAPPAANYDPRFGHAGEPPDPGWYWDGRRWVRWQADPVPGSDDARRYDNTGAPSDGNRGNHTYGSGMTPPYDGVRGGSVAVRPPGPVGLAPEAQPGFSAGTNTSNSVMTLPADDQPEVGQPKKLPERFRRQLVDYQTKEPTGTLVIDTANTYLYLVLGKGKAMRYGIGVGREGFTWAGTERISRMKEWPDWHPPQEMIERQPYLPRFMAGGPGNPLGARALYLGKTLYRIHGTNQPSTIGSFVSSGCIRLLNKDIEDLYQRINVGTRVVVLPGNPPATTAAVHLPEHDAANDAVASSQPHAPRR